MCGLKGHSALRPCWCCANVILRKYFAGRMQSSFVDNTCINKQSDALHTASSSRAILQRLETAAGADALNELGIVHGVRCVRNGGAPHHAAEPDAGLVPRLPLRRLGRRGPEALHVQIPEIESADILRRARQIHGALEVANAVRPQWPKFRRALQPEKSAQANLDSGPFSSSASELLSMIPVLQLYFDRVAMDQGVFEVGITSVLLVYRVVDLLQSTRSRHRVVSPEALASAIQAHMVAFYEAYGTDAGRPKHHAAAMHLADHYKRWGRLAPCFTHERFHKLAKSYASTRRNITSYARGIIEDIAARQMCSNEEATFGYMGLVNPVAPKALLLLRFRA